MRILLVNKFFYRKGGAETYFFALAEGLKSLGHDVAFFSMQHPNNEPTYWSKYFVSRKEYVGKIPPAQQLKEAATLIYSFEAKRKFELLLEEFKPDVIHLNNVHRQLTLSILDAPYLKEHHIPVVYTAHDHILLCPAYTMVNGNGRVCDLCLDRHFRHAVENTCIKESRAKSILAMMEAEFLKIHKSYDKIDLIIAPSTYMKKKLEEGGYIGRVVALQNFLPESQMFLSRKAANTHKFEDEALGQRPYFLFFGRLSKEKGILTLIKAFLQATGLLHQTFKAPSAFSKVPECVGGESSYLPSDWDLHIVGDGPERHTIEQLIQQAGVEAQSRIKLLGYKSGEDLQVEVGNARFNVLSSECRENMPYSGLESLSTQTPLIGANIGGIPELILEGKTGYIFNPGDVNNLAITLRQAADTEEGRYIDMQNACCKYIEQRCLQQQYVEKLLGLYANIDDVRLKHNHE